MTPTLPLTPQLQYSNDLTRKREERPIQNTAITKCEHDQRAAERAFGIRRVAVHVPLMADAPSSVIHAGDDMTPSS